MSEEEKKAIKEVKDVLNKEIEWGKNTSNNYKTVSDLYMNGDVETLLNLIENQQQELQLKDKVIEEMAGLIYNWDSYRNLGSRKTIVQYFINKVKGE